MRKNIRKILAVMAMTACVMCLTACNSSDQEITYDQASLQSVADILLSNWAMMDKSQIEYYAAMDNEDAEMIVQYSQLSMTGDALVSAFAGYQSSMEELGEYKSTDGYDVEVKGDEITLVAHTTYENRTADLSIVFNEKGIAQSVTIDPDYTMSEILGKAGMNTLLGMGTVFAVLIFLSGVIYCFTFIPKIQEKFGKKTEQSAQPVPAFTLVKPVAAHNPAGHSTAAQAPAADESELVAAITAAICAYTGMSSEGFVVRSIRRADTPTRNRHR